MRKKHTVRNIFILLLLAAVVGGLAVMPILAAEDEEEDAAVILSASAETMDLVRSLYSTAPLTTDGTEAVSVPQGVTITEYLVAEGDIVSAGDPIARVDDVSVMTAIASVQEALTSVRSSLATAKNKITPGVITVDEEGNLYTNGTLIDSDKVTYYSQYLTLTAQHQEYEDLLSELFALHETGVLTAPCDGMIGDLDDSLVQELSFEDGTIQLVFLRNIVWDTEEESYQVSLLSEPDSVTETTTATDSGTSSNPTDPSETTEPTEATEPDGTLIFEGRPALVTMISDDGDISVRIGTDTIAITYSEESTSGTLTGAGSSAFTYNENWEVRQKVTVESGTYNKEENKIDYEYYKVSLGDTLIYYHDDNDAEHFVKVSASSSNVPSGGSSGNGNTNGGSGMSGFGGGSSSSSSSSSTTATLYTTAKTQVCTVTPVEKMYLVMSIDEADILELAVGMKAKVTLEALEGEYEAVITDIDVFGSNSGGSSKFSVTMEIDRAENMLPGMNCHITFDLETIADCVTIPMAALVEQGSDTVVYTAQDPKSGELTTPVKVTTGFSDGENVQILSGLTAGTQVFYSYYDAPAIDTTVKSTGNTFGF